MEETVKPDAVEQVPEAELTEPPVSEPTKLIRIASMTRAMLDEVRQAPLDDGGRRRLADVHARSLDELREILSPELLDVVVALGGAGAATRARSEPPSYSTSDEQRRAA